MHTVEWRSIFFTKNLQIILTCANVRFMTQNKRHPITRYMQRLELTNAEFAEKIGVTRQRVSQIINQPGENISVKLAKKIVETSRGRVRYDELFNWAPVPKSKQKGAPRAASKTKRAGGA